MNIHEQFRDAMLDGRKTQHREVVSGYSMPWTYQKGYSNSKYQILHTFEAFGATFEITGVRAERVQVVTPRECVIFEGVTDEHHWFPVWGADGWPEHVCDGIRIIDEFTTIWNSTHGDGAWERNDWVWVYTFRRV